MLASVAVNATSTQAHLDRPYQLKLTGASSSSCKPRTCLYLPLGAVLPQSFDDMYTPDLLQQTNGLGRPHFTDRALVDWAVNDVRSLLIVEELRPEWDGMLPTVVEQDCRMMLLPLDASDDHIIDTLVASDIYKEHDFDYKFLLQTAQYTVEAARDRRTNRYGPLTKPEWRNIIENYLLNLGCEAQCRIDYKRACNQLKKQRQHQLATEDLISTKVGDGNSSIALLKRALLTSASSASPEDAACYLKRTGASSSSSSKKKASLSRSEKQQIWVTVQSKLYARLGLDWEADEL